MTNVELTPEQLTLVRAYLAKQAQLKAEPMAASDERFYYYVEFKGFGTVVPSSDCNDMALVRKYALEEPLQCWYFVKEPQYTYGEDGYVVLRWTHSQYCDWLRSKEL